MIKELISKDPLLVNAVAPKKPADTKGMSTLQVSLTTGWHRDIADFLLDHGADINFMEAAEWHVPQAHPVLHDAVCVAIHNARRHECVDPDDWDNIEFEWKHTKADSDRAYGLLKRMIDMGADVNKVNNYNDNVLSEAVQQASYLCPQVDPLTGKYFPGLTMTPDRLNLSYYLCIIKERKGVISMLINTNNMVSITDANKNFSRVARLVDEKGSAIIMKNNTPRYLVIEFKQAEKMQTASDEKVTNISARLLAKNKTAYKVLAK